MLEVSGMCLVKIRALGRHFQKDNISIKPAWTGLSQSGHVFGVIDQEEHQTLYRPGLDLKNTERFSGSQV